MATPYLRHHKTSILLYPNSLSPLHCFGHQFWPVFALGCLSSTRYIVSASHHAITVHRRIPYQHLVAPTCHIMLHHHSVPASYLTRVPYQHIAKTPYRTSISSRNTNDSLHHCIAPIYHTNIQSHHATVLYQITLNHHHCTTLPSFDSATSIAPPYRTII